jgi:periplasmic protein TonB
MKTPREMGWIGSVLTHALVLGGSTLLFASIKLPVPPQAFEMRIAVSLPVAQPSEEASLATRPPSSTPAPTAVIQKVDPVIPQLMSIQEQVVAERAVVSRQLVAVNLEAIEHVVAERVPIEQVPQVVTETTEDIIHKVEVHDESVGAQTRHPRPIDPVMESQPASEFGSVTAESVSESRPVLPTLNETHSIEPPMAVTAARPKDVMMPVPVQLDAHADYGWLSEALRERIEQLKRYPSFAKSRRWEGKVVIEADVNDTGDIMRLEVAESSGYQVLDDEAKAVVQKSSPVPLRYKLGQPYITIRVPISYKLNS